MRPVFALLVLESALLVGLSLLPAVPSTGVPVGRPGDAEHVALYAVYGVLLVGAFKKRWPVLLVAGTDFGLFTEALQVVSRGFDPLDVVINAAGVALGIALVYAAPVGRKRLSRLRKKPGAS
ncbi:MAG: VanZ family protein [Candidatus Aenigmarchaeota archaeon]|nr:VanZ family protein [Candidatus Aenigmarchaeota archaeon]